jgi:streptogramin lyase
MTVRGLLVSMAGTLLCALVATAGASAAPVGTVTEYSKGISAKAEPWGIAAGADGNMWFTEAGFESTKPAIARITPSGAVMEFRSGLLEFSGPQGITAGPDGNLWFADGNGAIGRVTPSGAINEYTAGITFLSDPAEITAGAEGNLWFTEKIAGKIGRITPAGVVKEFALPPEWQNEEPYGIALGPEGNLWFAEIGHFSSVEKKQVGGGIGRITPSGTVKEFSAGIPEGSRPLEIAQGADGNMWFVLGTGAGGKGTGSVGKITPAGGVTLYKTGLTANAEPAAIASGTDGNVWFTEDNLPTIGRISTSGTITEFSEGVSKSSARSIAAGPDGNLWFGQLEAAGESPAEVGSIVSGAGAALLAAPVVSGGAVAGTPQQCTSAQWSTWSGMQPSTSLFALDGYTFMIDGAPVGGGQSYTPPASDIGHSLSCSETVTYAPQGVTASATSTPVTVLAPTPPSGSGKGAAPGGSASVSPVLSGLAESASRWREGSHLAAISRKHSPPTGSRFKFTLNEAASVRLTFTQTVNGRRVKKRCVALTDSNVHRPSCKRTLSGGVITLAAHAGGDSISFQGRLSRSKKLAPGNYTVTFVAIDAAGRRSAPQALRFTILR